MDPSPTPWRVLEDPVGPAAAAAEEPGPTAVGDPGRLEDDGARRRGRGIACRSRPSRSRSGAGHRARWRWSVAAPFGSGSPGASAQRGPATRSIGRVVVVEIVGAVSHPGRLPDAATTRASATCSRRLAATGRESTRDGPARDLNLAAPLHDGDQIRVPSRDDTVVVAGTAPPGGSAGATAGGGTGRRPDRPEPGDRRRARHAARASDRRPRPRSSPLATASRSRAIDDLRTRKLVGEKTFANLKDLVTVR